MLGSPAEIMPESSCEPASCELHLVDGSGGSSTGSTPGSPRAHTADESADEALAAAFDAIECTQSLEAAASELLPSPRPRGCEHYSRGCRLRAPCCDALVACRFCHDASACPVHMDRHAVKSVACLQCELEQPPAAACTGCGHSFGTYFCAVCNLFDDDASKRQFHCDACGICRVGGRDNFFHCETCGACYGCELRDNHVCVPDAMQRDCPICLEYLFDSIEAPNVLKCGHTIHRKCLEQYSASGGYTCPVCSTSVCDMRAAWDILDREILNTPMPEEYRETRVQLLCNDCHAAGSAPFHALGLRCSSCGSYNTRRT